MLTTAANETAPRTIAAEMMRANLRTAAGLSKSIGFRGTVLAMIKTLTTWALALSGILAAQQHQAAPAAETTDPHSHARPAEARTTSLLLDWSIDFAKKEIAGTARFVIARSVDSAILDLRSACHDAAPQSIQEEDARKLARGLGKEAHLLLTPE